MSSARSGDGSLATGAKVIDTPIPSPTTRFIAASTSAGGSLGSMRQFTVARALCGSALSAWPPSRRVATHVVRKSALNDGSRDSRVIAA